MVQGDILDVVTAVINKSRKCWDSIDKPNSLLVFFQINTFIRQEYILGWESHDLNTNDHTMAFIIYIHRITSY